MVVDRSYSDFEAIRNYQDRGMMKWGAFATGKLSDAQQTDKADTLRNPISNAMSQDDILQSLITSWTNRIPVTLTISEDKGELLLDGQVSEIIDKKHFRFNTNKKSLNLLFQDVIKVQ